jgi:Rap1a immunity proteins
MFRIVTIAFFVMAPCAALAMPSAQTVVPYCQVTPEHMQSFNTGYCLGTIFEILDLAESSGICPPKDFKLKDAVEIVSDYANKHQKQLDNTFNFLAYSALIFGWPCRK